eukprot:SAG31_NODE_20416_length_575_cov_0.871849_1_plen_64_part_10
MSAFPYARMMLSQGKTIQTIALLLAAKERRQVGSGASKPAGPTLIVLPTSAMLQWESEIKQFCT